MREKNTSLRRPTASKRTVFVAMNVSEEFTVTAQRHVILGTLPDASSFVRFVDGERDLEIDLRPRYYEAVFETNIAYLNFKLNRTVEITRADQCQFVEDIRGSTPYKRELMEVYARRAVRAALDRDSH
jgi:hypothetical protein